MTDFTEWGEATSQAMGYSPMYFMEIYKENRNEQNIVAVNENLVSSILLKYIVDIDAENGSITETHYSPQELLGIISEYAADNNINIRSRQFPKDAASFVKKIKTVIPNFKAGYDIIITVGRNSKDNISLITISRNTPTISIDKTATTEEDSVNSSTGGAEPPDPFFTNSIKNGFKGIDNSNSDFTENNTKQNDDSTINLDEKDDESN